MQRIYDNQSGQVATEYVVTMMGMLIALAAFTVAGKELCVENFKGTPTEASCQNVTKMYVNVLRKNLEDITVLINLPF